MVIDQPVPELAVSDIEAAQVHFRDKFGFDIAWLHDENRFGAVTHGKAVLFLRETEGPIHPSSAWVFAMDVDAAHSDLRARGADIVEPIANMPWGLRQFTVRGPDGHVFYFHHDL